MNLPEFFAALSLAVSLYYYEDVDPARKPANIPQSELLDFYDFIIVGGGSAGSVLANRLTEVEHWNVLLIEAGGDEDAITDAPGLSEYLQGSQHDWNYTTIRQENVCGDRGGNCLYPQGRVLGGGSTINGMFYARGNKYDYDEWENLGNPGWSYNDVLKYFIKLESLSIPKKLSNQTSSDLSIRGFSGPLRVQYSRYFFKLSYSVLKAALGIGYTQGDYNGVHQERIDFTQTTTNGPSRGSAAKSYLNPVRQRKNLHVITSTFLTKLIFDDENTVGGVEYIRNGVTYETRVTKEVILSAGAINSPKILMLSGIGPTEDLKPLNINVVKNLPVGRNLQDHPLVRIYMTSDHPAQVTETEFYTEETILQYAKERRGPITGTKTQIMAFKSLLNETIPNGNWFIFGSPSPNNETDVLTFGGSVIKPISRGTVKISSANPFDPPLIDPKYLTEQYDRDVMRAVVKEFFHMLEQPALRRVNARVDPDENAACADFLGADQVESLIDCLILNQSTTYYHPVGTVRMGPETDANSVVNANLTVHGMTNLRVIDSSVMPNITRSNTNAPSIMIGEKGADLIKLRYGILDSPPAEPLNMMAALVGLIKN